MEALLGVFGRGHPLLLHLPIGLIAALIALELLARARRRPLERETAGALIALAALSAVVVAASGWTLATEPGYGGVTLERHRWLGVGVAVCAATAALAQRARRPQLYGGALALCALVLVFAGHFGSTLTHGAGFLTEPLREREAPREHPPAPAETEPTPSAAGPSWSRDIAPILAANCVACHGPDKRKGELALHRPDALLAGGESGPAVVPGDATASLLLQRALLPLDDLDHMPPEGKRQPSAEELELVRAWVLSGAVFDVPHDQALELPAPEADAAAPVAADAPRPDAQAVLALRAALVHVEELPAGSGELWIDFAAVATDIDDAALRRLLEPLREHTVELSLARTRVSDAGAAWLAGLPRLRRLDLRATPVGDAGVAALGQHPTLAQLVLAQTAAGDAAVPALQSMPALERVWTWNCALSPQGLAALRAGRPALRIDDGAAPGAAALEVEPEVAFSTDRPVPEQGSASAAPAPLNRLCPVSGNPVDARYAVVHEGRVIGFCCPNCPKSFWEDPAKFAAALE